MAARKNRTLLDDHVRKKIQTTQLLNRLQSNGLGKLELTSIQQRSCEILLRKTVPDLQAVQHSGDAENPIVHDVQIRPQLSRAEWEKRHVLKK